MRPWDARRSQIKGIQDLHAAWSLETTLSLGYKTPHKLHQFGTQSFGGKNLLCLPLPIKSESESEVAQSCLTLRDPMDCSLPGFIHGIFQARVLEWVAISVSRGSSRPRDRIQVSPIVGRCFYRLSHQGSPMKAIRLFFTTSPKTLSPRFYSIPVLTKAKFWHQYPYKKRKSGHTKRHQRRVCTDRRPYEEAAGRGPSASQEERLQEKLHWQLNLELPSYRTVRK